MLTQPRFTVSKTFGHDLGLSCAFRQHATDSHCRFLHGYALAFTFKVGSTLLDPNGWCFDFGGFKEIKAILVAHFDHTTAVAQDDPQLRVFERMHDLQMINLLRLPRVGCEAFARFAHEQVQPLISEASQGRAWLISTTVAEQGANSVTFQPDVIDELSATL